MTYLSKFYTITMLVVLGLVVFILLNGLSLYTIYV